MATTIGTRCKECGEPLKGRTDKRFCSDSCRNAFHYHANNAPINYVRNVVNALKRNRRVLSELNTGPEGKTNVHRDKLLQNGYNFLYHTHLHKTRTGTTYVFCFEQGYLELSENWFMLVRRDEYLERAGDRTTGGTESGRSTRGPDQQHDHSEHHQGE